LVGPSTAGDALPPHSRAEDVFLFVTDVGGQTPPATLRLRAAEIAPCEPPWLSIPDLWPTPLTLMSDDGDDDAASWTETALSSGDVFFLSAGQAWSLHSFSGCVALLVALPRQPSLDDCLPSIVQELQAELQPADTRLFPHCCTSAEAPRWQRLGNALRRLLTRGGPSFAAGLPDWLRQHAGPRAAGLSASHFDCATWVSSRHGSLAERLARTADGLLVITDFLPPAVAARCANALRSIDEAEWAENTGEGGGSDGGVEHSFRSSSSFPYAAAMFEMLGALLPASRGIFQAGMYCGAGEGRSDAIARHDDARSRMFPLLPPEVDDGAASRSLERSVAVVLHLTAREWRAEHGGEFVDYGPGEGGRDGPPLRTLTPQYNTLVAFAVPRWHEVLPVADGAPEGGRRSLFGWFYTRDGHTGGGVGIKVEQPCDS
jgi:hypothetical protein